MFSYFIIANDIININLPMQDHPQKSLRKIQRGQILVTILVSIAIFAILSHVVFSLIFYSYRLNTLNRSRITGRHLAQEKIELIRNLSYDDIGTQGGIPNGPIPQIESIIRNEIEFEVRTTIVYIDDEFDDTAPTDLLPTDYKRARVEVSWDSISSSRQSPIVLMSDIAPKGVESIEGGGTLSILVFNANGEPVPQAEVRIQASATNPAVDLTLYTSDNGRVILPGAPECVTCYEISVTKANHSTDMTYSISQVANPNKPHQTILENELTEISFAIDRLSTLNANSSNSREAGFTPAGNINFQLRGQKTIGTDSEGEAVYKFTNSYTTDSSGNLTINNLEWDTYTLILPDSGAYDNSGSSPFNPFTLEPNTNLNLTFALETDTASSLLLKITDNTDVPLASISATLSDGVGYEEQIYTGLSNDPDFGQSFFSGLDDKDYNLTATASGFLDFSSTITINGDSDETIILSPE